MQTHSDNDGKRSEFLSRLIERAGEMTASGTNTIAAGNRSESILATWDRDGMRVTHLPDDEQGILRISVGGGVQHCPFKYLSFRGDVGQCIELLEAAVKALRAAP